jgi:hypothetical protein
MKNLILVFILILMISCQESDKKKLAIENSRGIREKVGLQVLDQDWKLDSSFNFIPVSPEFLIVDKKIKEKEKPDVYYIADFYSDKMRNRKKEIYYKSDKRKLEIVVEEDTYLDWKNQNGKVLLIFNYHYIDADKSFRVDSFPSDELIRRNQAELRRIDKKAKETNMWVCGTVTNEILTKDHPKKHTFLKEEEFQRKLTALKK